MGERGAGEEGIGNLSPGSVVGDVVGGGQGGEEGRSVKSAVVTAGEGGRGKGEVGRGGSGSSSLAPHNVFASKPVCPERQTKKYPSENRLCAKWRGWMRGFEVAGGVVGEG